MGITLRERQIIERHERDVPINAIAEELDLTPRYVRKTVQYLCGNLGQDRQHAVAMVRGSKLLREAIEKARVA